MPSPTAHSDLEPVMGFFGEAIFLLPFAMIAGPLAFVHRKLILAGFELSR
jgi:hypothetical protein